MVIYLYPHIGMRMSMSLNISNILSKTDKRKVIFVRKVSGIHTTINIRKISILTTAVKIGDKQFPIDISKPVFRIKNVFYYMIDVDSGQVIYAQKQSEVSPEILDMVIGKKIVSQIVSSLEKLNWKDYILYIILSIGLGLALGFILGNYFPMNSGSDKVAEIINI